MPRGTAREGPAGQPAHRKGGREEPRSAHVDERRLLRGELDGCERRRFLCHLLEGCPECLAMAHWIWQIGERRGKGPVEC